MKCPYCDWGESKVVNSRDLTDTVRRRRECLQCHRRYTTFERLDTSLHVVKRDGRREAFDRRKLAEGVRKACHRRPVTAEQMDDVVAQVEQQIGALGTPEVESSRIGEMVLSQLMLLDDIAYIRFASVYRHYQDVESLIADAAAFQEWKRKREQERAQLRLPV